MNKIDKSLARITMKKSEAEITDIRNEIRDILLQTMKI